MPVKSRVSEQASATNVVSKAHAAFHTSSFFRRGRWGSEASSLFSSSCPAARSLRTRPNEPSSPLLFPTRMFHPMPGAAMSPNIPIACLCSRWSGLSACSRRWYRRVLEARTITIRVYVFMYILAAVISTRDSHLHLHASPQNDLHPAQLRRCILVAIQACTCGIGRPPLSRSSATKTDRDMVTPHASCTSIHWDYPQPTAVERGNIQVCGVLPRDQAVLVMCHSIQRYILEAKLLASCSSSQVAML